MANSITSKYDAYSIFLRTLITREKLSIMESKNRADTYTHILKLIKLKKAGKKLPKSAYDKLMELGCPDFDSISIFSDSLDIYLDEALVDSAESLIGNCSDRNCIDCWNRYIDLISECINKADVSIKYIEELNDLDNPDKPQDT